MDSKEHHKFEIPKEFKGEPRVENAFNTGGVLMLLVIVDKVGALVEDGTLSGKQGIVALKDFAEITTDMLVSDRESLGEEFVTEKLEELKKIRDL